MKPVKKVFSMLLTIMAIQAGAMVSAYADESLLAALDDDMDGYISLKEAVADTRLLRIFSRIDRNADGMISVEELEKSDYSEIITMNQ
ncbi:EF-hand domain-containing protein [Alteromonas sp. C1M14]|uniref:EF-hand domain-containing protein n=1 Tax=Alteromonas sp. C1M14 TaxID=2841567 RepID=UPI001C08ABC7|nr:EF-hand domain-containing protein [Alteromonas sp. C1M14]MBU2977406.1 EF-hand domain-containing protein [Alteromonas sp. C1M14]